MKANAHDYFYSRSLQRFEDDQDDKMSASGPTHYTNAGKFPSWSAQNISYFEQ